jgi:dihydrofolate reductase
MGKLVESTFVTLDGVISDPQIWGHPYWNEEHQGYNHELIFGADALLMGRLTYEGFADSWPKRSGDEFTDRINSMPKYVASNTLRDTTWNASVISGDVAGEVRKLKEESDQGLLKYGTGGLDRTLLENRLVDEYHFWVFPVFAGTGQRLFDGFDMRHLKLARATTFSTGIVIGVYETKD